MNSSLSIDPSFSRRAFLEHLGGGFGAVALAQMMATADASSYGLGLHHPAKARHVIQLFMNGGASQMDLFDYKPALWRQHGQNFDPGAGLLVEAATSEPGKVMRPPFPMRQHGQCGRWVSDILPHMASKVDEMAFFMAMSSRTNVHGPASYLMNSGFLLPGFPCLGAWVGYALGRITDELPTFVVLPDAKGLPYNQKGNFTSGFLPVSHQGTLIDMANKEPLAFLSPPSDAAFSGKGDLDLLRRINLRHQEGRAEDSRLEARIASYELAAKLHVAAPEAFDLGKETEATRKLYGLDEPGTADCAKQCLLARRLVERGVRFVQIWSGAGGAKNNWDNHASIAQELPSMTQSIDKPIAGLLTDLAGRGLLDDTLVLWNTEFGRMPFTQGSDGRDHNGGTFVGWMAGAGVRRGSAYGESDEWSWKAQKDVTTTYDFHATVLHLLGIDHQRLTFQNNGANRRLTDVHGQVVHPLLA